MPLRSTTVIPSGWAAYHRPVAASVLTDEGVLESPGAPGAFNPDTGSGGAGAPTQVYRGPCRVQRLGTAEQAGDLAGQQLSTAGYRVTLPVYVAASRGQTFRVTAVRRDGDPTLVGVPLRVRSVTRGTYIWQRDLTCEEVA